MPRAPWSSVPAARSSAALLKIKLYIVIGLLLLSSVAGIFAAVLYLRTPKPVQGPGLESHALGLATTVAEDYLGGVSLSEMNSVVQGLNPNLGHTNTSRMAYTSLTFDYFSTGPDPATVNGDYLETYNFIVTTPSGDFSLAVPMDITYSGVGLAANPSILPYINLSTNVSTGPAGLYSIADATPIANAGLLDYSQDPNPVGCPACAVGTPSPVTQIIDQWASDFSSNSASAQADLQQNVVGDASASPGEYIGLPGFAPVTSAGVTVVGGVGVTEGYGTQQIPADIFHVTLVLSPLSAKGFTVSSDYDLVVIDPATTTPHVVAWGPPGSGTTLNVYQNRI
jgi:hypothetical protein